ncbi:MAG: hypothetical protein CVU46_17665 [Chloroflexi bacterium HGW-Chloroflexi-8]|nr:MAG: hypothetical protein CVU46_17665 [Chloroflexi bacterium HGW-Chloroflexi-8]
MGILLWVYELLFCILGYFLEFPNCIYRIWHAASQGMETKKPSREEGFDYSKNSCFDALPVKRN